MAAVLAAAVLAAAVLAAASYSRIGFSLYFAVHARLVRIPGGSKFHLEPGTIKNISFDYLDRKGI